MNKTPNRVYVIMGDGEQDEGSIWEAAMSAGHYKLDNLTAIIDYNKLQIDGNVEDVMGIADIGKKYRAFRWDVIEIDGHDYIEIDKALHKVKTESKGRPTVIIANTTKGKGVSFMENVAAWHGKAPKKEEVEKALEELKGAQNG
jgi:transketolase